MLRKLLLPLFLFILTAGTFAQTDLKKWHSFDFSKKLVTRTQLKTYELEDLQLMRGIVFGKRGRVFKEVVIQDYLAKQSWYKPNSKFKNSVLTVSERKNID